MSKAEQLRQAARDRDEAREEWAVAAGRLNHARRDLFTLRDVLRSLLPRLPPEAVEAVEKALRTTREWDREG